MATTRSVNLSDEKKRDAVVALVFPEKPEEVTSKLPGGEAPRSIRFLKETVATNLTSLTGEFKDDDAVIDEAINVYYEQLKKNKHLK